jgi:hypothetical protein
VHSVAVIFPFTDVRDLSVLKVNGGR